MYKVVYYLGTGAKRFKSFKTLHEATVFANLQPLDSVVEIKYYEDISNYRPTFWCEE
jgi:hypothetical protein